MVAEMDEFLEDKYAILLAAYTIALHLNNLLSIVSSMLEFYSLD